MTAAQIRFVNGAFSTGPQGEAGPTGATGAAVTGPTGAAGPTGSVGATGPGTATTETYTLGFGSNFASFSSPGQTGPAYPLDMTNVASGTFAGLLRKDSSSAAKMHLEWASTRTGTFTTLASYETTSTDDTVFSEAITLPSLPGPGFVRLRTESGTGYGIGQLSVPALELTYAETALQGPTGPSGGPTGSAGAQGYTGAAGSQGAQGVTGPVGPQGTQGFTGAAGSNGAAGPQGAQGNQGFTGSQGAAGAQGFTGAAGAQGFTGAAGSQGPQGSQGVAGAQGNQGFTGAMGPQGVAGAQGFTGANGAAGAQGFTGPVGAQGVAGAQGFTGAAGAQGAVGPQGNQGFTGAASTVAGPQGAQGFTGATGPTAAPGATTQVAYNNAGALDADARMTRTVGATPATVTLTVGATSAASSVGQVALQRRNTGNTTTYTTTIEPASTTSANRTITLPNSSSTLSVVGHAHGVTVAQYQSTAVTTTGAFTVTQNCGANETVVGGGCESTTGASISGGVIVKAIVRNTPNSTGTGWICGFANQTGASIAASTYAICISDNTANSAT